MSLKSSEKAALFNFAEAGKEVFLLASWQL